MSVVIKLKVPIEMHYAVIPMGTSKVNSSPRPLWDRHPSGAAAVLQHETLQHTHPSHNVHHAALFTHHIRNNQTNNCQFYNHFLSSANQYGKQNKYHFRFQDLFKCRISAGKYRNGILLSGASGPMQVNAEGGSTRLDG